MCVKLLTDAKLSSECWHLPPLSILMWPLDVRVFRVGGVPGSFATVPSFGARSSRYETTVTCFFAAVKGHVWTLVYVDGVP